MDTEFFKLKWGYRLNLFKAVKRAACQQQRGAIKKDGKSGQ